MITLNLNNFISYIILSIKPLLNRKVFIFVLIILCLLGLILFMSMPDFFLDYDLNMNTGAGPPAPSDPLGAGGENFQNGPNPPQNDAGLNIQTDQSSKSDSDSEGSDSDGSDSNGLDLDETDCPCGHPVPGGCDCIHEDIDIAHPQEEMNGNCCECGQANPTVGCLTCDCFFHEECTDLIAGQITPTQASCCVSLASSSANQASSSVSHPSSSASQAMSSVTQASSSTSQAIYSVSQASSSASSEDDNTNT